MKESLKISDEVMKKRNRDDVLLKMQIFTDEQELI